MSEYEQEDRPQYRQIPNATWQAVLPQSKHGWYCLQCSTYMKLYPISHDLPPTHFFCINCRKNITMSERDECFEACIKRATEEYSLKTLQYSKEDRNWTIESAEFVGDSRINSRRKVIGATERQEIIGRIQFAIQDALHISFESFEEYFNEG